MAASYGAEVVSVDSFDASIQMIMTGRADASLNSELAFNDYIKVKPDAGIKIAAKSEEVETTAIPVKKGEERLLEAVNKALDELRADGTLKEISEKYFGMDVTEKP